MNPRCCMFTVLALGALTHSALAGQPGSKTSPAPMAAAPKAQDSKIVHSGSSVPTTNGLVVGGTGMTRTAAPGIGGPAKTTTGLSGNSFTVKPR
jgi:hypothetical protein